MVADVGRVSVRCKGLVELTTQPKVYATDARQTVTTVLRCGQWLMKVETCDFIRRRKTDRGTVFIKSMDVDDSHWLRWPSCSSQFGAWSGRGIDERVVEPDIDREISEFILSARVGSNACVTRLTRCSGMRTTQRKGSFSDGLLIVRTTAAKRLDLMFRCSVVGIIGTLPVASETGLGARRGY